MATQELPRVAASVVIPKAALQLLFDNLLAAEFTLVGPTVRDSAIVLEEISRVDELPAGWTDVQQPGQYRLAKNGNAYFDYNVGPQSWKRFLFPPRTTLYSIEKPNGDWKIEPNRAPAPRQAFIGVRACELAAIAIQDRVFLGSEYRDPFYSARREQIFVLAVNCSKAAPTCFCTSMKTGPKVTGTFDLALTELNDTFLIEVGSEEGAEMLRATGWQPASAFDTGRAAQVIERTERQIQRQMRTDDLPKMLYDNLEHPRWDEVAGRCLGCANCTLVCPTCFCSTVEDTSDLRGEHCERVRVWDSCFVLDFSHVHGGNLRPSIRARYRQWLTHKLGSWIDQFGTSGCVGCGRCITWCPVGIEITEEVKAIRERPVR
ncbi:MAG: 4Fe-4S dicluster domain-containing protein [Acidobacteria bacterium]|nr:4Fe-4S dicluster domain-containing protein [Acidobacteriota bacterium]MBI3663968.1 4Fe-4S dicluster domain-containing protein [Acidobacteriota bacterium]